jgi:hypothetical protein
MSTEAMVHQPASGEDHRGADGPKVVASLEKLDLITTPSSEEAIVRTIRCAGDHAKRAGRRRDEGRHDE